VDAVDAVVAEGICYAVALKVAFVK